MERILKKHAEKIKFAIVGGANTALDFAVLFLLTSLGLDRVIANYISTGVALIFSFFANKSFTFKNTSKNAKRQFIRFLIITLVGLWIIQPIIIWGVPKLLGGNEALDLFIAKIIATIVTMVWNYVLYAKYVFHKEEV